MSCHFLIFKETRFLCEFRYWKYIKVNICIISVLFHSFPFFISPSPCDSKGNRDQKVLLIDKEMHEKSKWDLQWLIIGPKKPGMSKSWLWFFKSHQLFYLQASETFNTLGHFFFFKSLQVLHFITKQPSKVGYAPDLYISCSARKCSLFLKTHIYKITDFGDTLQIPSLISEKLTINQLWFLLAYVWLANNLRIAVKVDHQIPLLSRTL